MKILRPNDSVLALIEYEKMRPRILSVVGAGGKTTLIFRLAEELKKQGLQVLIVTTTKMYVPDRFYVPWEEGRERKTEERIRLQLLREGIAVTGRIEADTCPAKFTAIPEEYQGRLSLLGDVLLAEADGSRQKPVKVPAEHEPVLFPGTELVIGVLGMKSVGQKIKDAAHRPEEVAAFLQTDVEHQITREDLQKIAESPQGLKKGVNCVFTAVGNEYESEVL